MTGGASFSHASVIREMRASWAKNTSRAESPCRGDIVSETEENQQGERALRNILATPPRGEFKRV